MGFPQVSHHVIVGLDRNLNDLVQILILGAVVNRQVHHMLIEPFGILASFLTFTRIHVGQLSGTSIATNSFVGKHLSKESFVRNDNWKQPKAPLLDFMAWNEDPSLR